MHPVEAGAVAGVVTGVVASVVTCQGLSGPEENPLPPPGHPQQLPAGWAVVSDEES